MNRKPTNVSIIRQLILENAAIDLEKCMDNQLVSGRNVCLPGFMPEEAMSLLAKAAFVRSTMDKQGLSANEAMRQLGKRMRRAAGRL